jgi:hypothetical protein
MAGTRTPIDRSLVQRLTGAVSGAIQGASDGWFGPRQPLPALAPPEVRGREFDYPVASNTVIQPRGESSESGIDFPTLRALADPGRGGLDLLRLAIETRKDQLASQKWKLRARGDAGDGGQLARDIERVMRRPDGVHTWAQWLRMLVEDVLVIDAPTLYLEPGGPNGWAVPQVMDGATLKRLIRPDGRTPLPPEPAFQQMLKGLPAVDYTLAELVHHPRNLRSDRLYGMSPVEQVVSTVNVALRRQMSQLEYYTAGSIPDVMIGVPDGWTSDQIKSFQGWWDSVLSGNTEERRRARFVPGGMTPVQLKPDQLKDLFDEWLARIICYAFSLAPGALVRDQNRATAETAKEAAQEEGLEPLKLWLKDLIDDLLERGFGAPDLELAWQDEEVVNPVDKATVWSALVGAKPIVTLDEARAAYGMAPLTPEQRDELSPPPPPPPMLSPPAPPAEDPTPPPPPEVDVEAEREKFMLAVADRIAGAVAKASRHREHAPRRLAKFDLTRDTTTGLIVGATLKE